MPLEGCVTTSIPEGECCEVCEDECWGIVCDTALAGEGDSCSDEGCCPKSCDTGLECSDAGVCESPEEECPGSFVETFNGLPQRCPQDSRISSWNNYGKTDTAEECAQFCLDDPECAFANYKPKNGKCTGFTSCDSYEENN